MENVNQIRLPQEFEDMPFDVAYDELKKRRKTLPSDLTSVSAELEEMSHKWQLRLTSIRDVLIDKTEEIGAIPKFGQHRVRVRHHGLDARRGRQGPAQGASPPQWGDDVIIEQTEIKEEEYADTPVALKNTKAIEPFQALLRCLRHAAIRHRRSDLDALHLLSAVLRHDRR